MKKAIWSGGLMFCCLAQSLQAEVEEITIRWNAATCLEICIPRLEDHLQAIKSVSNMKINARSGAAVMGWDPNYPFSYEPFRLASAAAGVRILDMRIRVNGRITHDVDNFYLISNGDFARFLIIGPIDVEEDRYVPRYNLATHPLTAQMKVQLLEAEARKLDVTISGPLYRPNRYPRTLIAENIRVQQTDDELMDPRYERY